MKGPFAAFKPILVKIKQLNEAITFTDKIRSFTVGELSVV